MKETVPVSFVQSKPGMSATEKDSRKPGYCTSSTLRRTCGAGESALNKSVGGRGDVSKYNGGVAENLSTLENFDCP